MLTKQFVGRELSRKEQKNINGGMADCSYRLCCTTPGGSECWNRSSMSGGASDVCQGIYPAYGGAVSGVWEEVCVTILD